MIYIVISRELGFWNGKEWVHTMEKAKRFLSQNAAISEMKLKGYDQNKIIVKGLDN